MAHGNSKPKSLAWRISWSLSRTIHGSVCGRKAVAFKDCPKCQPVLETVMTAIGAHQAAQTKTEESQAA